MIPLKDDNPTRAVPVITFGIIALNVLAFLYQTTLGSREAQVFLYQFGAIPYELTHFTFVGPLTMESPVPRYLTPVTAMFVHGGLMHLGGNMLYLWIFGNNVEDILGPGKFLVFYLLSGLVAALAQVMVQPASMVPMVGASGAIAGVLGAYFLVFPSARITTLIFFVIFIRVVKIPAGLVLGIWLILQMLSAASNKPGVAWFAHIGGFVAGMVLLFILSARSPSIRRRRPERF